ncbi:MAG: bifunctional demethylmenaquinone methyltransferase/2-methoxy-6-polyprenyl-1,4-benzoquinol methylase UbiE [Pirellulales bacterium]|nr:bifunctional demethylmenaquinone methyltransferase/2-methoxy-6-polyprenyl-1,4-benzoquinol methylase UbiE [Pirellulales bacterium]
MTQVDKSNARVQRMFGEIAPRYDLMNHVLSGGIDIYWRWLTARRLKYDLKDVPILDLCTGTGDLALTLAKRTTAPVIGADFCPEMLDIARKKAVQAKLHARVAFVEADAQQLPFETDHFQLVTVAFGLRNVSDTDQGLREMTRVCRPGGQVAVLEFSTPRWQPFKACYQWYFKNVLPRVGQALARNSSAAYEYLPASVGEFPAYQALVKRMEAAGLANVKFYPLTLGVATLYVGEKGPIVNDE